MGLADLERQAGKTRRVHEAITEYLVEYGVPEIEAQEEAQTVLNGPIDDIIERSRS